MNSSDDRSVVKRRSAVVAAVLLALVFLGLLLALHLSRVATFGEAPSCLPRTGCYPEDEPFDRLIRPNVDILKLPASGIYITTSCRKSVEMELGIEDGQGAIWRRVVTVIPLRGLHFEWTPPDQAVVRFVAQGAMLDEVDGKETDWHYRGTYGPFPLSRDEPVLLWLSVMPLRPPEVWLQELAPPAGTGANRTRRWRLIGPDSRGITVINETQPPETLRRVEVVFGDGSITRVTRDLPPQGEWAVCPPPRSEVLGTVKLRTVYADGRTGHQETSSIDCTAVVSVR